MNLKHALEARKERKRLQEEAQAAQRRSMVIEEDLKDWKIKLRKETYDADQTLLIGLPGSGKSTTVKYFRMIYAKREWEIRRSSWRAVVRLNIVQSTICVLEFIKERFVGQESTSGNEIDHPDDNSQAYEHDLVLISSPVEICSQQAVENPMVTVQGISSSVSLLNDEYKMDFELESASSTLEDSEPSSIPRASGARARLLQSSTTLFADIVSATNSILTSEEIRGALVENGFHVDYLPWLNSMDISRISGSDYQPSDIDIMRANLRSVGLRKDPLEQIPMKLPLPIIFYDIGRSVNVMRTRTWIPFIDTLMFHLIFHTSVSISDEFSPLLGQKVKAGNYLEDSMTLWSSISASPFLRNTYFLVFFTKVDLLERQLDSGIRFKDHVKDYNGSRNDAASVLSFWRRKFADIAEQSGYRMWNTIRFFNLSLNEVKSSMRSIEEVKMEIISHHIRCTGGIL